MDSSVADRIRILRELAEQLHGHELVPGFSLDAPTFGTPWNDLDTSRVEALGHLVPADYITFMTLCGGISAIDTAGGVEFMSAEEITDHMAQDYAGLLVGVTSAGTFPFATNGAGAYLLLAADDSGVWKYNVHMAPVARPEQIAPSFCGFLDTLAADWSAVLEGKGGPYATS